MATACGDDAAATKKDDAAVPRDTMVQPNADAPPLLGCVPRAGNTVSLRPIADLGATSPMLVTAPKGDGRLFVVEREGRIRIIENETLRTQAFLDMSSVAGFASGGEQGLLGLAFHPDYATNRQFFVYYTTNNANVVARYYVSETDYNKADPAGEVVLSIPDFASNHNGGMIDFGPNDGYLYIGTGDGGQGGDPCRNAQQLLRTGNCVDSPPGSGTAREPLLGKMLRIDVNTPSGIKNYSIPPTNPYADGVAGEAEIFIRGLRNPWRWSFDTMTGDLYIGDVGQEIWEEVTVLTPAEQSGANLGWSVCEGAKVYPPAGGGNGTNCTAIGVTLPHFTRSQGADNWMAIIGGQVYRGTCFPDLVGDYFFTDYVDHGLARGRFTNGTLTAAELPGTWPTSPSSIHADSRGELFMTTESGNIYQIEAGP